MADEQADVVIAGAGPNGLLLACELALAGLRPVVLDALPGPSSEPKANGLVGQVVRMLDMRGLYQAFTGDGPPQPSPGWMFAAMPLIFSDVPDNPMYAMLMPQPRLVRLLEKRARDLGVDLRWSHELVGIAAAPESVALRVSSPERDYTITAGYAVGADGGRSLVRKSLGIDFPGTTSPMVSRLAHVHIPDEYRRPDIAGIEIPGFGPLRFGHSRFDRGGIIYAEFEPGRALLGTIEFGPPVAEVPMTLEELRQSARRVLGADIPFEEPKDAGPHALRRINGQNTRHAERYRKGRVLLLGDAAHVHSAMGGPGLNLGLQDTINLGWKLAAEINGTAPAGLLDTYQSERHPVGQRVMMHSLSQIALMAPGPEVAALRTLLGELFTFPDAQQHMAALLAGSDVRYDVGDDHRLSGHLVPDLTLDDGRRVAQLLHDARPVLLDLGGGGVADAARGWDDRVDVVTASAAGCPAAALLIRPDGYVAWAADEFGSTQQATLRAALQRWFGPPTNG